MSLYRHGLPILPICWIDDKWFRAPALSKLRGVEKGSGQFTAHVTRGGFCHLLNIIEHEHFWPQFRTAKSCPVLVEDTAVA